MTIKILGGKARGLSLASPRSDSTRPTSVMLKRRIFDANQDMHEITFIDLCAGGGPVGLEAASRGAKKVYLVELASQSFITLQKNTKIFLERCPESDIKLAKADIILWLSNFLKDYNQSPFTERQKAIIFLDPPYQELSLYSKTLEMLKDHHFCGRLWVEACRQKTMPEANLEKIFGEFSKIYHQGTSYIAVCDFR